jgi:hypothetical protein
MNDYRNVLLCLPSGCPFCFIIYSMDRPRRKRLPHDVPQWVAERSFFSSRLIVIPSATIIFAALAWVTRCSQRRRTITNLSSGIVV